ncbi:MAG: RNA polymerase sigma factor [Gammaproteobacteria bacterium]|nr:RNA polymerase sigma factor [Gammaproteobacteria bacterium]
MSGETELPSFEEVATDLYHPLRRYLENYVGDQTVAEDLLQETLLKISKGLPSFAGRSSIKTWAFAIAYRVGVDYFRAPQRRAKIVELDEEEEQIDNARAVDENLIAGQMNDCIKGVIDSLPGTYRAALVLSDIEQLTAKQTAEILGCSLENAKIRIHRARKRLKKALEESCDFYRDNDDTLRCDEKG